MASKLYEAAGWSALGMLVVGTIIGNSPPLGTRGWGPQVFPPPVPAPVTVVTDPKEADLVFQYISPGSTVSDTYRLWGPARRVELPDCATGWRCLPLGAPTACECEAQP